MICVYYENGIKCSSKQKGTLYMQGEYHPLCGRHILPKWHPGDLHKNLKKDDEETTE